MTDLLNTNIGPERVQVFAVPLGSTQPNGVSTSVAGFLVATDLPGALKNTPTLITSFSQFTTDFGTADNLFFDGYYAVQGYYDNAGTGAPAYIVNVGDGAHQVTTVGTVADVAGSLAGTYFTLNSGRNKNKYYVWYSVSSVGVDPAPAGRTAIPVAISTGATAGAVAAATQAAIAMVSDFTATVLSSTVTVTNAAGGVTDPAADGAATTGFTIATPTLGTDPSANDFIGNSSTGTGLRALDTIDSVGLLTVPGLPISEAYLVDPAVIDYSKTVRADFGSTLGTMFSLLAIPKEINKTQTDTVLVTATVDTVTGLVVAFSGSPDLSNVVPGYTLSLGGTTVGTITDVSGSSVTLTSVGTLAPSDVVQLNLPSAITYKEKVVNDPSNLAAWYYNNVLVLDASSTATPGQLVTSSPVGHVAGVMARMDANVQIGGPSHAPAGLQYAGLANIQGLNLSISERLDAGPLRLHFINRLTSFPGAGNVVFGAYTADSGTNPIYTSDEQLIQVMRTIQFIKASLQPALLQYIWENFSPATQGRIANSILSFLLNNIYLFPAGLPQNQQFNIISVTPTTNELAQGLLRVRVQIRPNSAIRFIEVDLEFPLPSA